MAESVDRGGGVVKPRSERASDRTVDAGDDGVRGDLVAELERQDVADERVHVAVDVAEARAEVVQELQPIVVHAVGGELRRERHRPLPGADADVAVELTLLRPGVARLERDGYAE